MKVLCGGDLGGGVFRFGEERGGRRNGVGCHRPAIFYTARLRVLQVKHVDIYHPSIIYLIPVPLIFTNNKRTRTMKGLLQETPYHDY